MEPFQGLHKEITGTILNCSQEILDELGFGFLESVYQSALAFALRKLSLRVEIEKPFPIVFRGDNIGVYYADLVVEEEVIVELKCCEGILSQHKAQVINYLSASHIAVGLLLNFGRPKLQYCRLTHPNQHLGERMRAGPVPERSEGCPVLPVKK